MTGSNTAARRDPTRIFAKNRRFSVHIACMVVDGVLDGCNFALIYLVIRGVFEGSFTMSSALAMTAAVAAVFVVRLLVYGYGYLQGQIGGAQISRNIRVFLGEKIKRIPLSRFTERSSGDYLNALTVNVNDYEQILTHKTGSIVKNVALAVMLITFVTWLFAPAGAIVAAMFLLIVPGLAYSWHQVRRFGARKSAIQASNASAIVEHVTGMQTLRAYGIGGTANERIVESMRAFSDISYRYEAAVTPPGAVVFALVGMGAPALFLVCCNAVLAGTLDAVSAVLIIMLPLFIIKLTAALFVDLTAYRNLSIAKGRIADVAAEVEEQGVDEEFSVGDAGIELSGVDFAYEPGNPVFRGLELACAPGSLTALVGDSGCGKSTALSLVAQYYRPDAGSVLIGGSDSAAYAPECVLEHVSIVDQDVFLFDDSVAENVRYAKPDASDEEIRKACRLANADGFIGQMPEGYASRIGENGSRLSGGERQRLSIARAILRDSPIVLLDEATASLDIENELAVKRAIRNLLARRKTVIMIAHTLPIVRTADSIAVIGDGRVIEQGTHEELVARGGKYAAMWAADRQLA